jgi:PKD repeat protein
MKRIIILLLLFCVPVQLASQPVKIAPSSEEKQFHCKNILAPPLTQKHSSLSSETKTSHTLAVFYVVPSNVSFNQNVLERIVQATLDLQAWYQAASGGLTWELAFQEVVRAYNAKQTREFYRDNGNWWGSLLGEMANEGLPIWSPGMVTAIWAHGAGWWAGGAQGCGGECGVALLGVEIFPEFNAPAFSGGECPSGQGVAAWPCTPVGAYAHELGHTLGLIHPADNPATAAVAGHSIMQTHWNYPDFAPESERPWGFLTNERATTRANPFMHKDIALVQTHQDADVAVNLPQNGATPAVDFYAQVSGNQVAYTNNTQGATLYYWTFGDESVSNEVNPNHTYQQDGIYTVTLRASSDQSMMGVKTMDVQIGTATSLREVTDEIPAKFNLEQNYPNPFNPTTEITFALSEAGKVTVSIFSETGQIVKQLASGKHASGYHRIQWNGRNESGRAVAAGVYFYQLVVTGENGETVFTETKRMTLVK